MSDAPLFQHTDEQEATLGGSSEPADRADHNEEPVAIPAGLAPGGMGGGAAVSSIPGVLPPGVAPLSEDEDDEAGDAAARRD